MLQLTRAAIGNSIRAGQRTNLEYGHVDAQFVRRWKFVLGSAGTVESARVQSKRPHMGAASPEVIGRVLASLPAYLRHKKGLVWVENAVVYESCRTMDGRDPFLIQDGPSLLLQKGLFADQDHGIAAAVGEHPGDTAQQCFTLELEQGFVAAHA